MPSPASTDANIQTALNQALESASGRPAVTNFGYKVIRSVRIDGVLRSIYVTGMMKGAAAGGGAPGGACWFDCSLTASATAKATALLLKLQVPFG
jgi:hypothetical protein